MKSTITREQMLAHLNEADRLISLTMTQGISPFGAALAGVALIRNAIAVMGSDPEWWVTMITDPDPSAAFARVPDGPKGSA